MIIISTIRYLLYRKEAVVISVQDYSELKVAALDYLEYPIALLDHTGEVITTNRAWEKENSSEILRGIKALLNDQQRDFQYEIFQQNKWFEVRVNHLDGKGTLISLIDISKFKIAEEIEEKKKNELENIKLISQSLAQGVFILDTEQQQVQIFGNWLKKGSLKPEEFIEQTTGELLGQAVSGIHETYSKKVLQGENVVYEWETLKDSKIIHYQTSLTPVFDGQRNIIGLMGMKRDITLDKRDKMRAEEIQKQRLDTQFPLPDKAELEVIYRAAYSISGDLFHLIKKDDHTVFGFLGDVSGKGIAAALTNSAVNVLFANAVTLYSEPMDMLNYINSKLEYFTGEEYVAACCFRIDFLQNKIKIASGGINKFFFCFKDIYCLDETVKGPFLGMFNQEGLFEEKEWFFRQGDRFYFFTDGFGDIFIETKILQKFITLPSIGEQKEFLNGEINKIMPLLDDTTWLAIEIK